MNFGLAAHILMLLILFSIAFWDSINIINDYIYNNRLTLVKIRTANGSFPYLDRVPFTVCLNYEDKTIFPEMWANHTVNPLGFKLFDQSYYQFDQFEQVAETFKNVLEMSNDKIDFDALSLKEKLNATILFEALQYLDMVFGICNLEGYKSCPQLSDLKYLDNILEKGSLLEDLHNNLWNSLKQHAIWRQALIQNEFKVKRAIVPYYLCVDISLNAIFVKNQNEEFFLIGSVGPQENSTEFFQNAPDFSVNVLIENVAFPQVYVKKGTRTSIRVDMKNVGVFDVRTTTKCKDTKLTDLSGIPMMNDSCVLDLFFELTATECGCVPFANRNQFRMVNPNLTNLPFCSVEIYEGCFVNMKKAIADRLPCLPNCITVKNDYSFFTTTVADDQDGLWCLNPMFDDITGTAGQVMCSPLQLILSCSDSSFAVYEERYQLSPSQLLSQVGGDIGLYTGVSLLGIYQVLLLMFQSYHKRKKTNGAIRLHDVFKNLLGVKQKTAQGNGQHETDNKIDLVLLKEKVAKMEHEQEKMTEKITDMEKKVNDLAEFIKERQKPRFKKKIFCDDSG